MIKKAMASIVFALNIAVANPVQIGLLNELVEELNNADEKTLVVFDVDEVLITTEDHFIQPHAHSKFMSLVRQAKAKKVTEEEKEDLDEILSLSMLTPKRILIEEKTPHFIKELQERGVKVIALTSCPTGKFGLIPKIEHWRIEHLNTLNINFTSSFPEIERHSLTELENSHWPAPLYEEGILFSCGYKKGEVLKAFFKRWNFTPSKVIFIDDLSENLENVKSEMESLNITFKGYQYTGAERFFKALDEAVINYQFEYLLQNREWLSDTQVRKHLLKAKNH